MSVLNVQIYAFKCVLYLYVYIRVCICVCMHTFNEWNGMIRTGSDEIFHFQDEAGDLSEEFGQSKE